MDRKKLIRDIMTAILIGLPFFLLLAGKGRIPFLISLAVYLLICTTVCYYRQKNGQEPGTAFSGPFLTIFICLAAAVSFYFRWNTSGRIGSIAAILNKSPKQTCIVISLLLAALSAYGVNRLISVFLPLLRKKGQNKDLENTAIKIYIFLTSFLTVTLNSRCAPIYPFNHWVDPNTMFTVGKAVLKGYVPYRDLYEQKGPLLIFLHTFGAAISFTSFTGMWVVEVIFCFLALFYAWKILSLFLGNKSFILVPLTAFVTYSGYAFRTGDLAEEYCLPFLICGLYTGCKAVKNRELPSRREFFLIGLTSSCVFWIKYSMVGFYLGWYAVMLILAIRTGCFTELIKRSFILLAGLLPVTAGIVLYFAVHSSLGIFYETYFTNNLIPPARFAANMQSGYRNYLKRNPLVLAVSAAGLLWFLLHKKWKQLGCVLTTYLFTFIFVYVNGNFPYYSFIFGAFAVFGTFWIGDIAGWISRAKPLPNHTLSEASLFFSLAILAFFSYNVSYLENRKEDLMQYKMKEVIEQSGIENPTLFYYRTLDLGINTTTGMIPNVRYFCLFNVKNQAEMNEEQAACLREGCADFVTAFNVEPDVYPEFEAYEHQGWFVGPTDNNYGYYHYYTRK